MRTTTFQCNGVTLNVVRGPGKIPVIFQHGLCGQASQTIEAFPADDRFGLVTVECRGHGTSEPGNPKSFSIECFTDDVAAYIAEENLGPCIVGGISMGAAISLRMAVKYPQHVKAIALVRPAWVVEAKPANMQPNLEVGMLLRNFPPGEAKAKFLQSETAKHLEKTAPDNLASLIGFFSREPVATTQALLTSIASDSPGVSEQDLASLKIPALVIGHQQDVIHPFAHTKRLHHLIPNSNLLEITPKAVSKSSYVKDLHHALLTFFEKVHA